MKGKEGDTPPPPPLLDIMAESIDAVLCTFSADRASKGGGGWRLFGHLPMAWQLEFEPSSLCHYYNPLLSILLATVSTLTQEGLCIHHPPSSYNAFVARDVMALDCLLDIRVVGVNLYDR